MPGSTHHQIHPVGRVAVRLLPMALAFFLLAGCLPTRSAFAPPVDLPEQFSQAGAAALPDRWWLAFDDPALNDLIERALAGNLSLLQTWERLRQAEATARKAGADLYPSLDLEGSAATFRTRSSGRNMDRDDFSLGLFAGYEIDLWGRVRAGREAALMAARATAEDLQSAALTLSAETAVTWYRLLEQQGQLQLIEMQSATNKKVLQLIELRFRTGQTGIADVLQQRQLVEANRGEQAQVAGNIDVLKHQLALLLGLPPGALPPRPAAPSFVLPPLPQTGLPAELVRRRPDVRRTYFRLLAADRDLAAAVADRFPRLGISAGLDTGGEDSSALFHDWVASLAANLAAPLIDGGRRRAEVERSRAVAAELLHAWGEQLLRGIHEVEDALAQEASQRLFLASLEEQLSLAAQVSERLRERYLRGAIDYQRVLDALISHQRLQRSVLAARRELTEIRIDLYRALAGGWELNPPEKIATLDRTDIPAAFAEQESYR